MCKTMMRELKVTIRLFKEAIKNPLQVLFFVKKMAMPSGNMTASLPGAGCARRKDNTVVMINFY